MTFDFEKATVGSIVYGYEKGIHKVVAITPGCGCGKCFHLERILNSKYTKGKGKSCCDGAYIRLVDKEELKAQLETYTKEALANVEQYL